MEKSQTASQPQRGKQAKKQWRNKPQKAKNGENMASLKKFIATTMKQFDVKKGQSYQTVADKFYDDKDFGKAVASGTDRFTVRQMETLASHKAIKAMELQLNEKFKGLSPADKKDILACFIMDDWSDVASVALNLATKYGPDLYKWMKSWWEQPRAKTSNSSLQLPSRNTNFDSVSLYQPIAYRPTSLAVGQSGVKQNYSQSKYQYDAVSINALKSWINCSDYIYRRPLRNAVKTAQFFYSTEFNLTSDANGNVGAYIFPQQAFAGSVAVASASNNFYYQTTTGFVPTSGVYTAITPQNGPMYGLQNTVSSWCLDHARVEIIPITSMTTNQGRVELLYFQRPPFTQGPSMTPLTPQAQLPMGPFYQVSNMNTSLSSIRLPTDPSDDQFIDPVVANGTYPDGTQSSDEGWYILMTGCNPSAVIATLRISICGQWIPVQSSLGMNVLDYPEPGIATQQCISNLILECPRLQSMSEEETKLVTDGLQNIENAAFNEIVSAICPIASGFKPRSKYTMGGGSTNLASMPSIIFE